MRVGNSFTGLQIDWDRCEVILIVILIVAHGDSSHCPQRFLQHFLKGRIVSTPKLAHVISTRVCAMLEWSGNRLQH